MPVSTQVGMRTREQVVEKIAPVMSGLLPDYCTMYLDDEEWVAALTAWWEAGRPQALLEHIAEQTADFRTTIRVSEPGVGG